jgi:thiosulfate sulfurtransferase
MPKFQLISTSEAQKRLLNEKVQMVDIRDENSFLADHVEGSFHLTDASVAQFMQEVDFDTPVFVICYHGNSSKGVAQYLCDQGYLDVYSVEGGFAGWRIMDPHR